jgi:hypothetical protein
MSARVDSCVGSPSLGFYSPKPGLLHFMLPSFQILRQRTEFINGRHRDALLLRYLDRLPLAVVRSDDASELLLRRIVEIPLLLDEFIELPDLPIMDKIPPANDNKAT